MVKKLATLAQLQIFQIFNFLLPGSLQLQCRHNPISKPWCVKSHHPCSTEQALLQVIIIRSQLFTLFYSVREEFEVIEIQPRVRVSEINLHSRSQSRGATNLCPLVYPPPHPHPASRNLVGSDGYYYYYYYYYHHHHHHHHYYYYYYYYYYYHHYYLHMQEFMKLITLEY